MTDHVTQEAAACLRDDPSFRLMNRLEQEAEAAALLAKTAPDLALDPISVALVIEAALSAVAPEPASFAPAGVEPCRENRHDCRAVVGATGRCLDCGARRKAAEPEPAPPVKAAARNGQSAAPDLFAPPAPMASADVRELPLLYRLKAATGWADRQLAEVTGKSRATVQAYIGGRLPEVLGRDELDALVENLEAFRARLAAAIDMVKRHPAAE